MTTGRVGYKVTDDRRKVVPSFITNTPIGVVTWEVLSESIFVTVSPDAATSHTIPARFEVLLIQDVKPCQHGWRRDKRC